jgi:hypothetical protein
MKCVDRLLSCVFADHDTVGSQVQLGFDEWIPLAIKIGKQLEAEGGEERIRWLGQSWIFDLFLNCDANLPKVGGGVALTCPNASAVADFRAAVKDGTITWHAFPHNAELEVLSAFGLRNGIDQAHALDTEFGLPPKRCLSVRDVPGIPRGAIAPAAAAGVDAFSIGANGRIVPPLLAPAFRWTDSERNASALVWFHAFGYGHDPAVFSRRRGQDGPSPQPPYMSTNHGPEYVVIPGSPEALVYDWRGDNAGPPTSVEEVKSTWKVLHSWWPDAKIVASDLDAFTASALPFAEKLPVVTKELGDTWVMGVPSDPTKVATMRAMDRQLSACAADAACSAHSPEELKNFSRYWIKNSEHTWGVSVQHFGLWQRRGWSNSAFRPALSDPERGAGAVYKVLSRSWKDQYAWGVTYAMDALSAANPLKMALEREFAAMAPGQISSTGYTKLGRVAAGKPLSLGWATVAYGSRGEIISLKSKSGAKDWASAANPLALLRYQSLSDATFGDQMRQSYLFRHPTSVPGNSSEISGANEYGKPGVDRDAHPLDQLLSPTLKAAYTKGAGDSVELLLEMTFPLEVVTKYGAPASAWLLVRPKKMQPQALELTLELVGKQPTRLPEATWLQFSAPDITGMKINKLSDGSMAGWVNPLEVVDGGAKSLHGISPGGPALQLARQGQHQMLVTSMDAGVVRFDTPYPTPTPIFRQPDVAQGAHFGLHMNTWNTNYPFWWPYQAANASAVFRFELQLE